MGSEVSFYVIVLLWVARTVILAFVCALLALLGLWVLDVLTPSIRERERIGENPVSVGMFVAGFLILIGLAIHGTVTGPVLVGAGVLESLFDLRRLAVIFISFVISLLLGIVLLRIVDKLTPKISFISIGDSPIASGTYMLGYLVFFGLIIHAALTTPL
ncbi:MAG: DUF350 domain-containing protein [Chloroflexi bacterium]|nr:DUF350 domain-containing protein [Chloroflexota bacterium]